MGNLIRLYYANDGGNGPHGIVRAVYDRDDFVALVKIGYPYSVMTVDEVVPDNQAVCYDLVATVHQEDVAGDPKYFVMIESGDPTLHEKDGWEVFDIGV